MLRQRARDRRLHSLYNFNEREAPSDNTNVSVFQEWYRFLKKYFGSIYTTV